MYKKITLLLMFFSFCSVNTWAWNAEKTHKDLSEKAAEYSVLAPTNGDYLKNLGFDNNLAGEFTLSGKTKKVKEWIGEGGVEEDAGNVFTAYYYHHFHNPLALSWNQAGLSTYYPWINGMSSLLWAQNASNPWSWQKIRGYYYLALTSQTDAQRQENFAKTFKGVGHITHLVEDVAQPAHVRNDPHPLDDNGVVPQFENWAKNNRSTASSFMSNPITFSGAINSISSFFDTNQYTLNSAVLPSGNNTFGLSEYTQANFFSEDTINVSNFPYPKIANTTVTEKTAPRGIYQRQYYLKKCCGETKPPDGYLLSAVDYLDYYRQQYPSLSFALPKIPVLDNNVYSDYASLLLPRAVGYSAGILNYFFRGKMDMDPDADTQGQYIIKNQYSENMSNGTFSLYYDAANESRKFLTSWNMSINANSPSSSITFTPPTDADQKGKYIIAFQGTLGSETGAVVGKTVDICAKAADLNISGPDNITGGAQYTATGGIAPYTWSISNGSVSDDGLVTILDQCASGTAAITVTDYCGKTQTKTVAISAAEPLTISGPNTPSDGSQYTASGGKGPYTYSISQGSITQDGIITLSGQCGTVIITATDSCSNSASKTIDTGISCGGGGGGGGGGGPLCTGDTPELVISGTDAPSDGSQYTTEGGTAPYTWSISMGSITQDGVVTISNQCGGTATITLTDACGKTQTKGITIPLPPAITLSGPDAPTNGSPYGAEGGIAPYTWSISKGSITQDGVVTVSGQCGTATITVTDACGNQGSKDVRMPSGVWALIASRGVVTATSCTIIQEASKTEYWWKACCDGNSNSCKGCKAEYSGNPIGGMPPCGSAQTGICPLPCGTNCSWCYNTFGIFNYEWRCQ